MKRDKVIVVAFCFAVAFSCQASHAAVGYNYDDDYQSNVDPQMPSFASWPDEELDGQTQMRSGEAKTPNQNKPVDGDGDVEEIEELGNPEANDVPEQPIEELESSDDGRSEISTPSPPMEELANQKTQSGDANMEDEENEGKMENRGGKVEITPQQSLPNEQVGNQVEEGGRVENIPDQSLSTGNEAENGGTKEKILKMAPPPEVLRNGGEVEGSKESLPMEEDENETADGGEAGSKWMEMENQWSPLEELDSEGVEDYDLPKKRKQRKHRNRPWKQRKSWKRRRHLKSARKHRKPWKSWKHRKTARVGQRRRPWRQWKHRRPFGGPRRRRFWRRPPAWMYRRPPPGEYGWGGEPEGWDMEPRYMAFPRHPFGNLGKWRGMEKVLGRYPPNKQTTRAPKLECFPTADGRIDCDVSKASTTPSTLPDLSFKGMQPTVTFKTSAPVPSAILQSTTPLKTNKILVRSGELGIQNLEHPLPAEPAYEDDDEAESDYASW